MYARILVPIDGSPPSNQGLMEAIKLAKDQKAKMRLLHVIDQSFLVYDAYGALSGAADTEEFRDRGEQVLADAKNLAAGNGVEFEAAMVETQRLRVANVILQEARDWHADIIVMGTRGRRGFSHLVLGSDAEAVLHDAPVPVLLIRALPEEGAKPST